MIRITPTLSINEEELEFRFLRAAGPGGQKVNKVSSAVQLRFDVVHSPSLSEEVRHRLLKLGGKRVNAQGELVIEAMRYRAQEQNRQDAIKRLAALIRQASQPPRARVRTRMPEEARRKRLQAKRLRSEVKRLRRRLRFPEE